MIKQLKAAAARHAMLSQREYDRRNPVTHLHYDEAEGVLYEEMLDDGRWQSMGHVPKPQSTMGWFVYHTLHGILMRYPLHKVLLYAIGNSPLPNEEVCQTQITEGRMTSKGWECPKCGSVYAPWVYKCSKCRKQGTAAAVTIKSNFSPEETAYRVMEIIQDAGFEDADVPQPR